MYKHTIIHTRPTTEVPFFWEVEHLGMPRHEAINKKIKEIWGSDVEHLERIYSEDRLTATTTHVCASKELYYQHKKTMNAIICELGWWEFRNKYNKDRSIIRQIVEEDLS